MAFNSRQSIYSTTSTQNPFANPNSGNPQATTSSLLAALHNAYQSGIPYNVDAATTLVVNGVDGDRLVLDETLVVKAWEHARRRAEDQTVVTSCLQAPGPSLLVPLLNNFPGLPDLLPTALSVVQAFTNTLTPLSPHSLPRYSGLSVTLQVLLSGNTTGATIALSSSGLDVEKGLLNIPSQKGYRAFDVFYYILTSAGDAERSALNLKSPDQYSLLARSGTYTLPADLPTADDDAAAEDFRAGLRSLGIKGAQLKGLLSVVTGILNLGDAVGLLVDEDVVEDVCEDVGALLGLEPEVLAKKLGDTERSTFIEAVYELVVEWVVRKANEAIAEEMHGRNGGSDVDDEDSVMITILDVPSDKLARALCLKGVFDDQAGLNLEMKQDGVQLPPVNSTVSRELTTAWSDAENAGLLGTSRDKEYHKDRKEGVVEKAGREVEEEGFLKEILFPEEYGYPPRSNFDIVQQLGVSRVWYHLNVLPIEADGQPTAGRWSAAAVSKQVRAWRLPEWVNRRTRKSDFTADFDVEEFYKRYAMLGCMSGRDGAENWVMERGWSNGEVIVGSERVWMMESSWWEAEQMLDLKPAQDMMGMGMGMEAQSPYATQHMQAPYYGNESRSPSIMMHQETVPLSAINPSAKAFGNDTSQQNLLSNYEQANFEAKLDPEIGSKRVVTENTIDPSRKAWVAFVWALTFWIPSFVLRYVGRMKRPDVRLAWREKFVLCFFIFLLNAIIIFYIAFFGRIVCPRYDKAYTLKDVSYHQGDNDYWAAIHGKVYDFSEFWRIDHSDTNSPANQELMQPFAGKDLSVLFPPPIWLACPGLKDGTGKDLDRTIEIRLNDTAHDFDTGFAMHKSGPFYQPVQSSQLYNPRWYPDRFVPKLKEYWKGDVVWDPKLIKKTGMEIGKPWAIYNKNVYDLTDYMYTLKLGKGDTRLTILNNDIVDIFKNNPGKDVTALIDEKFKDKENTKKRNMNCINNLFFIGIADFRKEARCQFNSYLLPIFAGIMCAIILTKFLAALQLGSKRRPAMQDKFVICQVPAYTEGEDQLRKALDSLTALSYDNKRKLLFVVCDGMIVGGGNERPTPQIVLDILGVDPKIDPPALPFLSVGEGSNKLNYGKVYSGLYEYEGCVVPYIVVVKVGKPSEISKPGNRGKRDSQILLLRFLNRVHDRSAMCPLELEMFHQINNIIGVNPELYEYLLMVDADTTVKEDALTRLVASCANDAKVAGICGETSLENEEGSWTTMIQVYEYYISHHLSKAFESLFGSVTCLPGCFSMYRLRDVKGKPLIIHKKVIDEYAIDNVDTLHKKNLLSLGEDRFLTTLMTKHFPKMSYKFIPDAYAQTAAPDTWSVLLSQRRRWINSTIHNLVELVFLKELCGFCCFSMRFVVFIDLFGTIILPSTCVYIGYLIYMVISKTGAFPLVSIIMIAVVYGLQAVIFIIKRQWQHVGWMIIYILAFPIYSFILPIYSFWNQDNFTWGSTRIVIGESGNKQVVATDDEGFDPDSIPLESWDSYANRKGLPGARTADPHTGIEKYPYVETEAGIEMDDLRSQYSSAHPHSTILPHMSGHFAPPPASPLFQNNRNSTYSALPSADYYQDGPNRASPVGTPGFGPSTDNLLGAGTPPLRGPSRSPLGGTNSRPMSTIDLLKGGEVDEEMVVGAIRAVLRDVDLDNVTKKQVRVLVEQRLGFELGMQRRAWVDGLIDNELAGM